MIRVSPNAASFEVMFFLQASLVSAETNPIVGLTGAVEADFVVNVGPAGAVAAVSAANYVISEVDRGWYLLAFTTLDDFDTDHLNLLSIDYDGDVLYEQVYDEVVDFFRMPSDVLEWNSTAVATPTTAGVPRVDVKAMEANTLTAAALASDAVTEIQSGLATSAALVLLQADVDDVITTLSTLASDVWNVAVEGSHTAKNYIRGLASALIWKAGGMATSTRTFRDAADTKNRISATVDATGRTSVTFDGA